MLNGVELGSGGFEEGLLCLFGNTKERRQGTLFAFGTVREQWFLWHVCGGLYRQICAGTTYDAWQLLDAVMMRISYLLQPEDTDT